MLATRILALRAFDKQGTLRDADLAEGDQIATTIDRLFTNAATAYIHIHFPKPGGFEVHGQACPTALLHTLARTASPLTPSSKTKTTPLNPGIRTQPSSYRAKFSSMRQTKQCTIASFLSA